MPYSGITNNIWENINCVVKDMLKWREAPVDVIVLCFQLVQTYYVAEIRRWFAGVGNYTLSIHYMHCSCNLEDAIMPQVCNIDNRNCMLHLCDYLPWKKRSHIRVFIRIVLGQWCWWWWHDQLEPMGSDWQNDKYSPKRQSFSHKGMIVRTELAVLDHNNNLAREQATTADGRLCFNMIFPKRTKGSDDISHNIASVENILKI